MGKTDKNPKKSSRYAGAGCDAFTLVEIMVVVAIVGVLASIGIPSFAKARNQSRISRYLNDIRQAIDYIELYAMENGSYPPDKMPRQAPDGLHEYVKRFDWNADTPLGGKWDWDFQSVGITAGVTVIGATASLADLLQVDQKIDDGNLVTGRFRRTGAGGYTYVVAD
ncbi:MAG: type II secretion system protein [Verrucomicrobia bacterium]|jgi:prepilin-type N-terminal cleavage/methylation domain-containing protein|nr:type II secretion system protein [Verrucomicrobiota bacterium]MBT7069148.1 type II secretion system protein [Verrucomicrobiota bacterium]MBT7701391.1 type II secretion system protein [Verrucomicrobiota bacterium]